MEDLTQLIESIRLMGSSLRLADRDENLYVPEEVRDPVALLGRVCSGLAAFMEQLHVSVYHAEEIRLLLREEALARASRDQQMQLTFREERSDLVNVVSRLEQYLVILSKPKPPPPPLVAAFETLETLRSMPSDGAPREVVEVLRRLDASLTSQHIEEVSCKLDRLFRVVREAEALVDSSLLPDQTQALQEALWDLRALD